ncbi:hypothetical protein ACJ73_00795 [Blastomyces percursus]|uniref:Uncharacterized protein n=1 Tax=Blastomyces percursus TaxID=1658174 RepID=A0A1J9QG44_9EURO|nr:hypothetical protein ACJ73_00795 [Blastomyces percursus]
MPQRNCHMNREPPSHSGSLEANTRELADQHIRRQSSTNTSRRNQFDLRHGYVEDKPMITTLFGSGTVEIYSTRPYFPASLKCRIQPGGDRSNGACYAPNKDVDIPFCLHRKINRAIRDQSIVSTYFEEIGLGICMSILLKVSTTAGMAYFAIFRGYQRTANQHCGGRPDSLSLRGFAIAQNQPRPEIFTPPTCTVTVL